MSKTPLFTPIKVKFFKDAKSIYGDDGLTPSTFGAVGIDLRACFEELDEIRIMPGERQMIPVGIAIEIEDNGIAGFIYSRSGLGGVKGLIVAQGVGIIDPDYRGEISVPIFNSSQREHDISKGERIAQIVFHSFTQARFKVVEELSETDRGQGGFGHTGTN